MSQEDFEIVKHYADVLRMHFHWISCYSSADGISYRENEFTVSKTMPASSVIAAGREIEAYYKRTGRPQ